MKEITFSEGKLPEFNKFYKLFSKSLKEQFDNFPKNAIAFYLEVGYPRLVLKKQIKNGKRNILLAKNSKNEVVGYLLSSQDWGGVNIALWLGVEKEYQKRGIATKLLKVWEESSKKHKNHALLLYTRKANRAFYKNRGFLETGLLPGFWFGVDSYVFYKKIGIAKEENYLADFLKNRK